MREIVAPAGRVISLAKTEETGVMQRWTAGGPRHVIYSTLVILRRACWPAADQTLFVTGDEGDGCYRVEEGLLKASVAAATGGERILAILGPGSVVGADQYRYRGVCDRAADMHRARERGNSLPFDDLSEPSNARRGGSSRS
jgi:hypothetical protein